MSWSVSAKNFWGKARWQSKVIESGVPICALTKVFWRHGRLWGPKRWPKRRPEKMEVAHHVMKGHMSLEVCKRGGVRDQQKNRRADSALFLVPRGQKLYFKNDERDWKSDRSPKKIVGSRYWTRDISLQVRGTTTRPLRSRKLWKHFGTKIATIFSGLVAVLVGTSAFMTSCTLVGKTDPRGTLFGVRLNDLRESPC